ncbi:hypothetical protein QL995_17895 [Pseudoalteromonas sp. APC 3358]|uniref:hypothetical protein n=1 Tax=Pseudoalteromonas sp. APC 3358 TaxID=3035176 RepID=UPI0025B5372B|nr:hypothetical protein [Pseudoalteromonas sp. APC 3358]MDN3384511.1 hypothetical protein [Pseudoalteromonas sp. APC 3358]
MNIIKIGLIAASISSISTVSACEKWQFIVTGESQLISSTLEIEYEPTEQNIKIVTNEINVKGDPTFEDGEKPNLELLVSSSDNQKFTYELMANLPVTTDEGILLRPIAIEDVAPLRDGYLNFHQRGDIKITLYGQQLTCTD